MKNFSDLNIVTERFTGKKIEMDEILDTAIEVLDYRIEPSKYSDKGNGLRLTLQIRHQERERIIFTGSKILQEQCEKVQEIGGFPFRGTIVAIKPKGFKFI